MQGVVRQHPEATQPPESSVESLGTLGARVSRRVSEDAAAGPELEAHNRQPLPAPATASRMLRLRSLAGGSSGEGPLLQGHVEESVERSPSGGESPPGGFAVESVQGVVRQYPGATQPPESSVESLGDAPVGLSAEQGVLTPEMVQEAVAGQSPSGGQSGEVQSSVSEPGSGQEQAGPGDAQQSGPAAAPDAGSPDGQSAGAQAAPDAQRAG